MAAFEPLGETMQVGVAESLRLELADRRQHVIAVGAGMTMTLPHEMELLLDVEPAGILRMTAIDHVDQRASAPLGLARPWSS